MFDGVYRPTSVPMYPEQICLTIVGATRTQEPLKQWIQALATPNVLTLEKTPSACLQFSTSYLQYFGTQSSLTGAD